MKPYNKIEKKLVSIMSKQYMKACNERDHLIQESLTIDEYETIIEKTINAYNYNGHNFNPAYLPVILSMALKEQEFQNIQDIAWNKLTNIRPDHVTENSILKENLNICLNYLKVKLKSSSVDNLRMKDWDFGYDTGYESAIEDLEDKIKLMTETDKEIEQKIAELAEKAEGGYIRLE